MNAQRAAPPLLDAHLHLQDPRLDAQRESVINEMRAAGIERWVVNGTDESDWDVVAALALAHPEVVPCFGLHPWKINERSTNWLENLRGKLEAFPDAGVGEIGLDKWIRNHDLDEQVKVFRAQLEIAAEQRRPAMIHCLKCFGRLHDVLSDSSLPADFRFLLHSYSGPVEMVDAFAELGAYFSFSGYFLESRKTTAREVFVRLPSDRLLIETDAPDMPLPEDLVVHQLSGGPTPERLNHPANLPVIYEKVAALRQIEESQLKQQLADNFAALLE